MIENYSTTCIAVQTDTTPSTLIRIVRLFSKFRKLGVDARTYTNGQLLPEVLNNKRKVL
ncbi:hypothetical protein [Catenibacterium mitsuokai]|uniref:hypothetical protein n=1 Tax=Catenibacterium mitsuokai TaxID=100886 RepID=UPI00319DEF81